FEGMLRARFPRWLAIAIALLGTLAIVAALLWLVGWQIGREADEVGRRATAAWEDLRQFLIDGPLHLSAAEIDGYLQQGLALLNDQSSALWSGALAIGGTAAHV